jgi:hypothetical protein
MAKSGNEGLVLGLTLLITAGLAGGGYWFFTKNNPNGLQGAINTLPVTDSTPAPTPNNSTNNSSSNSTTDSISHIFNQDCILEIKKHEKIKVKIDMTNHSLSGENVSMSEAEQEQEQEKDQEQEQEEEQEQLQENQQLIFSTNIHPHFLMISP